MIVTGATSARLLARAIRELGGTIVWPGNTRPAGRVSIHVLADEDEVSGKLGYDWLDPDDEIADPADPRDVHDFVAALSSGDRLIAQALAPRLWPSPINATAAERGLFDARAA